VLTSSVGAGRRAASTDWRLETSADGRGLRLGASSPEVDSIGFGRLDRSFVALSGMAWGRRERGRRERCTDEGRGRKRNGRRVVEEEVGNGDGLK
jgi:hypothetical protein